MLHSDFVGHFDPHDFLDRSMRPYRRKVLRPLSREAMDRMLAQFDCDVAQYVWYDDDGYVGCDWSRAPGRLWDSIIRFSIALASSESALILHEGNGWVIERPEDAARTVNNPAPISDETPESN